MRKYSKCKYKEIQIRYYLFIAFPSGKSKGKRRKLETPKINSRGWWQFMNITFPCKTAFLNKEVARQHCKLMADKPFLKIVIPVALMVVYSTSHQQEAPDLPAELHR
jgi:hypothetical protein